MGEKNNTPRASKTDDGPTRTGPEVLRLKVEGVPWLVTMVAVAAASSFNSRKHILNSSGLVFKMLVIPLRAMSSLGWRALLKDPSVNQAWVDCEKGQ